MGTLKYNKYSSARNNEKSIHENMKDFLDSIGAPDPVELQPKYTNEHLSGVVIELSPERFSSRKYSRGSFMVDDGRIIPFYFKQNDARSLRVGDLITMTGFFHHGYYGYNFRLLSYKFKNTLQQISRENFGYKKSSSVKSKPKYPKM